ncbi:MAG: DNA polymerase III subunit delta [Candidatus Nealsonbacteria bacterium RIFCSPLOWO2_01_FULL_43_36]|uniref:DNA polymerase III subunit delta n=1 Tax=Candidatus Nealsonbacteria bacterium RIFCSPHIGHO2_02_FULL_43_13 TaxID=1801668 RepID=A0A1G2E9D8_9BACT|nr:MAG: polymerase III, delta subunit protein [Parcubacteria group bacterium GW2011_GWB1_43_6]OGZ22319.1 MAG: DNA polymerase III subunit delta [Candidatus Nealsonbacteria bacterium RIFCSPHIGHO2_02_FULL_43_13]OGZ24306.1 MAG: DNA polymerase III subunit delta [Candidatus Nealsonbacteria bacterium RIFCSPLOWO2_01_FULL_43_36]
MIIFLYGEDTYRSRRKLEEIVAHYKEIHQSGLNLKYFDGNIVDFQDFKSELQTVSMFKEKKLLILTDVFSNQEFKDGFLKDAEWFVDSDNVILFYEEKGEFAHDRLFTFFKKHAQSQEFELLTGLKIKNWLKDEFTKNKTRIDPMALETMVNFAGNDLWQLANDVQKLVAYKRGKEIETKDVRLFVKPKLETDIFKTIDAISLKNKKQALNLLHKHLEKGDSPLYLLSMINFQFRNILGVKDLAERGEPLSSSGLKPFLARKSSEQARKFTYDELKKIYQKIFQIDYSIKTGKLDPQAALDLLIAEL